MTRLHCYGAEYLLSLANPNHNLSSVSTSLVGRYRPDRAKFLRHAVRLRCIFNQSPLAFAISNIGASHRYYRGCERMMALVSFLITLFDHARRLNPEPL